MTKIFRIIATVILLVGYTAHSQVWHTSKNNLGIAPELMVSFGDSTITPAMTQNNWVSISNATNTLFTINNQDRITFDGDSVTIDLAGGYDADISMSYAGANTDSYEVAIFKNNAIESTGIDRTMTSNSIGVISITWHSDYIAGDDLTLKIRNVGNSNDATLRVCQWRIKKAH